MPKKRKAEENSSPKGDGVQTPLEISRRKRVTAFLRDIASPGKLPTASASASVSVSSSSSATTEGSRRRKKQRLENYYWEMRVLNTNFASWAKQEHDKLCHQIETNTVQDMDYSDAALKYMRVARDIKRKYFPPTGDVLSFGTNEFGQIGHGESVSTRMRPALVATLRNTGTIQAAAGGLHSLTVSETGIVNSWGCNDDGALGVHSVDTLYTPNPVKGFVPSTHERGKQHLTVPKYTWKDLANANREKYSKPEELEPNKQEVITAVEAGDSHSLALSHTGRVYFFGSYKDKEGKAWRDCPPPDDPRVHPDEKQQMLEPPRGKQDWPIHVWNLNGKATQIACGFSMNAAIVTQKTEGEKGNSNDDTNSNTKTVLMTWGLGESGELARPVFGPLKKTDDEINALPEGSSSYDNFHVDKLISDYLNPQPALFADGLMSSRTVKKVVCGGYHMLVIASDGGDDGGASRIYSTGLNNYGQLGLGDFGFRTENDENGEDIKISLNRHELTKIPSLADVEITEAAAGEHHSLCLDTSGTKLYAFGRSCSGQCGHLDTIPEPGSCEPTPVPVYLNPDDNKKQNPVITQISSGGSHNFALTAQGNLYTWGYAFSGACGVGKTPDKNDDCVPLPTKVQPVVGVNKLREKEGKGKVKCTGILSAVGGGQHSVMIATLQEM